MVTPWDLGALLWAAQTADPLRLDPTTAERLREACGVPRHVLAAVAGVGERSLERHENGRVRRSRSLEHNVTYHRALGALAGRLRQEDPQAWNTLFADTPTEREAA